MLSDNKVEMDSKLSGNKVEMDSVLSCNKVEMYSVLSSYNVEMDTLKEPGVKTGSPNPIPPSLVCIMHHLITLTYVL